MNRLLALILAPLMALAFALPAAAQQGVIRQTFNPSGPLNQGFAVLVDPATGLPYAAGGGGGSSASIGAVGATAPTSANQAGCLAGASGTGVTSGQLVAFRCDNYGGQIGGMLTGTPTRSASLTTSASTALGGAGATTRPSYLRVTVEAALTANLFLCLSNQTCSATVYDEMIPSGAAAGTRYFSELPFTSAVTYFTTATAIVNVTRMAN